MRNAAPRRACLSGCTSLLAILSLMLACPRSLPSQDGRQARPMTPEERQKLEAQAKELYNSAFRPISKAISVQAVAKTREAVRRLRIALPERAIPPGPLRLG